MTVIRDAVIRVRLEHQKSKLEVPDTSPAERAYQRESKAADAATKATERHTEAVKSFGVTSLASFREAGEGAFRLTRGLALLSSSGSEDLRKLIRHVALAQAAFDIFAGGVKVFTNLSALLGGPVSIAITGVGTALAAGGLAWRKWQTDAESASKASAKSAEEAIKKSEELADAIVKGHERLQAFADKVSDLQQKTGVTDESKRLAELEASRDRRAQLEDNTRLLHRAEGRLRHRAQLRGDTPIGDPDQLSTLESLGILGTNKAEKTKLLNLAERREQLLTKELEYQQKTSEATVKTHDAIQTGAIYQAAGVAGSVGPVGAAGIIAGSSQVVAELKKTHDEVVRTSEEGLKAIAEAIRATARLVLQLKNQLDGANSAR